MAPRNRKPPCLGELAENVWQSRRVSLRYRRWGNQVVERTLEPLGLVLKAGNWYLAAHASSGREPGVRTYRVSRIVELTVLDERFDRPADFDLTQYWQEWSAEFEKRLYPRIAVVRMSAMARELVPFYCGAVGVRAVRAAGGEPDENGWLRVELPVEPTIAAIGELLRFGAEIEVLEPAELREQVADALRRSAARYG